MGQTSPRGSIKGNFRTFVFHQCNKRGTAHKSFNGTSLSESLYLPIVPDYIVHVLPEVHHVMQIGHHYDFLAPCFGAFLILAFGWRPVLGMLFLCATSGASSVVVATGMLAIAYKGLQSLGNAQVQFLVQVQKIRRNMTRNKVLRMGCEGIQEYSHIKNDQF